MLQPISKIKSVRKVITYFTVMNIESLKAESGFDIQKQCLKLVNYIFYLGAQNVITFLTDINYESTNQGWTEVEG